MPGVPRCVEEHERRSEKRWKGPRAGMALVIKDGNREQNRQPSAPAANAPARPQTMASPPVTFAASSPGSRPGRLSS